MTQMMTIGYSTDEEDSVVLFALFNPALTRKKTDIKLTVQFCFRLKESLVSYFAKKKKINY